VIEREHAQAAVVGEQRADERAARPWRPPRPALRMLVSSGGVEQRFQDAGQVANRNLLAQKLLQHFLHFSEAEYLGNQFFDQLGVAFTEPVEQALGFLPVSNS